MQTLRQQPDDPMSYQAPKISTQVALRVEVSTKNKAEGIRRCWNAIARAKGENLDDEGKEVEVEASHVYRSLLAQRVDEEAASLTGGKGFPRLDDEKAWKELLAAIEAGVAKASKQR